jgi:hypothetical protein
MAVREGSGVLLEEGQAIEEVAHLFVLPGAR